MLSTETILAILSIIGFIGALPQIWGSSWKDIWVYYKRGTVSWKVVHNAYLKVARELKHDAFSPTAIIGVGRGGIVSAGLLSSELVTERLVTENTGKDDVIRTPPIKIGVINSVVYLKRDVHRPDGLTVTVDKIEFIDPDINLEQQDKVLLVVAQSFTGSSLNKAVQMIVRKGVPRENIKTAAIFLYKHKNIAREHTPDIFGKVIEINKTMPWKNNDASTDRY